MTPEHLNDVPRFGDLYQYAYAQEHRPLDLEHGQPLLPLAAAFVEWDGAGYHVHPGASNIAGIDTLGPGDFRLELAVPCSHRDEWFPVFTGIGSTQLEFVERDDGSRTPTTCRVWSIRHGGYDSHLEGTSFFVRVFARARAPGDVGRGDSTPPAGLGVRNRIAVDGPETAEHRRKLRASCADLKAQFDAGHDPATGKHTFYEAPLCVALLTRLSRNATGYVVWQAGLETKIEWVAMQKLRDNEYRSLITFDLPQDWAWTGVLASIRFSGSYIPKEMTTPMEWTSNGRGEIEVMHSILAKPEQFDDVSTVGLVIIGRPRG